MSQLNLAVWALWESLKDFHRRRLWPPFLVLGIAQLLLVLALTQFHLPLFSWAFVPFLRKTFGEAVLHYPIFFLALPDLFSRINMFMDYLLGCLTLGVAALIIWRSASHERSGQPWSEASKRYASLLLGRTPAFALILLMSYGLPILFSAQGEDAPGSQVRAVRYGGFLIGVLIESLFVYTPIMLLVEKKKLFDALRSAVRLTMKVPVATFLFVMLPNLVQIPLSVALRRADVVMNNLSPEMVAVMVMFTIAAYIVVNYFMVASAVRVYGARGEVKS
ncbi:MAG: hypothetical protein U0527_02335 [Candidatus Eisenbacteria bacterium]